MKIFKKFFRKETTNKAKKREYTVPTMTVDGEFDIQEVLKFTKMKVNFHSPKFSWKREFPNKVAIYDIRHIEKLEDISLVLFDSMFSDTVCYNSALILAILMYTIVEETYKNGQKFASLSELLTYSFEEDGHFYTPQDIEKALAKHCFIVETSEDANEHKIA